MGAARPRPGPQPHASTPATSARTPATSRPPAGRDATQFLRDPVAFLVEYADGFRGTSLILNGHVDDTTIAARLDDATGASRSSRP